MFFIWILYTHALYELYYMNAFIWILLNTIDTSFKKFWIVENSFPIVTKLKIIDTKKKAKGFLTFEFTTLYTTIPHNILIKVLSEVINFVFKLKTRSRNGFSKTSIYWASKDCGRRCFAKQKLPPEVFIKKGVFQWILQNFKEHLFYRTPQDGCFWQDKLWLMPFHFLSQNVILSLKTKSSDKRLAFLWAQTQLYNG